MRHIDKSNEIDVVFHNDLMFDFHLIIKELANEFHGQVDCIAENNEKYQTFSILIKKVVKIDKGGNKTTEFISYKIKFIDNMRFMEKSLSNLVDNLTRGVHKLKCKTAIDFLNMKMSRAV